MPDPGEWRLPLAVRRLREEDHEQGPRILVMPAARPARGAARYGAV